MFLELFRDRLIKKAGGKQEVATFLQKEMAITKDGAYRRLRGTTAFHFDEVIRLAKHFDISLDTLMQGSSRSVNMEFFPLVLNNTDYFDLFNKYFDEMNTKEATLQILYKKVGMYYYSLRKLMYFNAVYFYRVSTSEGLEHEKFSLKDLQKKIGIIDPIRMLGMQIFDKYQKIPSIEVFGPNSFDNMFMRIKYAVDCGFFMSADDALEICDELGIIIEHFKFQALKGAKYPLGNHDAPRANFTMYYYDESQLDNMILLDSPHNPRLFNILNIGDVFVTENPQLFNRIKSYVQNILKLSEKISGENERGRNKVFSLYMDKLESLRNYISS